MAYLEAEGFVRRAKVMWEDPALTSVELALAPAAGNTFFKHQIRRATWNKDGPLSSANCAPMSLAMTVALLGLEPPGASVEKSIHRVRAEYDGGLHEHDGTTRAESTAAAESRCNGWCVSRRWH